MAVVIFVRKFGEKNITFIFGSLIATDIIQFIIRKSCLFILTSSWLPPCPQLKTCRTKQNSFSFYTVNNVAYRLRLFSFATYLSFFFFLSDAG